MRERLQVIVGRYAKGAKGMKVLTMLVRPDFDRFEAHLPAVQLAQ